jgi:hypothetical protein
LDAFDLELDPITLFEMMDASNANRNSSPYSDGISISYQEGILYPSTAPVKERYSLLVRRLG